MYSLADARKIVTVIEKVATFTGNNLSESEEIYVKALQFLLNEGVGSVDAIDVLYDNAASGLLADNVQEAVDELSAIIDALEAQDIAITPSGSLTATNVRDALYAIYGRVDSAETRITTLENGYIKATNFEIISGANGSIAIPTGATILLDEFAGDVDAIVSEIDGSNTPTWVTPRTAGGATIAVSSFDVGGNYILTGVPVGSIALVYVYRVQRKDFDYTKALQFSTLDPTAEEIKFRYESNPNTNAFTDAEQTKLGGIESGATGDQLASEVPYDNSTSGIVGTEVQAAIDELAENGGGGAALGSTWRFDNGTSDADPGSKKFRFNNATQSSATFIYVNEISDSGIDVSNVLSALKVGDRIYTQENEDASKFHLVRVIGAIVDASPYYKIPIVVESSGSDLENNRKCGLLLIFTGDVATNLAVANRTATTLDVTSSNGNDATLPQASATEAGLLNAADKVKLNNTSGTNTGDEMSATESVEGIAELATQAEADIGTDDVRIITALKAKNTRGVEPFFLNPRGLFGSGGGWAGSGFIDDVPYLFFSQNRTERAIYMFFAINRAKFDAVDPVIVFLISSVGAPVATTGDQVVWELQVRYRADIEALGGAANQTIQTTQTLTTLVANSRQTPLEFTLNRALIANEDHMHFTLSRLGSDAADNYSGDIGVGQSGIQLETVKHTP